MLLKINFICKLVNSIIVKIILRGMCGINLIYKLYESTIMHSIKIDVIWIFYSHCKNDYII